MKIQKIIWQTHKWEYEDLPEKFKFQSKTWQEKNKDWEYRYISDKKAYEMIKDYSGEWGEDLLDIYKRIVDDGVYHEGNGGAYAHRADLWRYLTIYHYGGIYADMDSICTIPLNNFNLNYDFVYEKYPNLQTVKMGETESIEEQFGPHFFGGSKNNFMSKIICTMAIEYLRSFKDEKIKASAIGPFLFTNSINYFKNTFSQINNSLENIYHGKKYK